MKTQIKFNFSLLAMFALVFIAISLSSCGNDEDEVSEPNPNTTNDNLNSGLVAHYQFNQGLMDERGNFLMQSTNNEMYGNDRFGNGNSCLEFDGLDNNQHAWIADSIIEYGKDFSISYWMYLDTVDQSIFQYTITCRFSDSGVSLYGPDLLLEGTKLTFVLRDGAVNYHTYITPTQTMTAKKWYHTEALQEDSITSLYIDKQLAGRDTIADYGSIVTPKISYWAFGSAINPSGTVRELDGKLDDIRFYNRAINEEEINALNAEGI